MPLMPLSKQLARDVPRLPLWTKLGVVVVVLGLAADVFVHLVPGFEHEHGGASPTQFSAHLIVFIGMVLVLFGIVLDGLRPNRAVERTKNSREAL